MRPLRCSREDFIAPYRCDCRSLEGKSDGGPNRSSTMALRRSYDLLPNGRRLFDTEQP